MQRNRRRRSSSRLLWILPAALVATAGPLRDASATSLFRFENRRENPGMLRLLPEIWLLSTSENYDGTGAKVKAPGLDYSQKRFDLTGVYGLNPKMSIFARLSLTTVSFTATGVKGSGSGLGDQGIGLNYRVWESAAAGARAKTLDFQFSLDVPMYDNVSARRKTPRLPLLGDGTLDITAAGFGTFPLNQGAGTRLFAIAGLGLTLRNNSYSKALPYQLQLVGLPERNGLTYRLGLHGFKSLTSDPGSVTALSPQAQIGASVDPQDAGRSLIVDALNSTYMTVRGTLGYQWGQGDQIYATLIRPLSGTSTAAINGILLGGQFRFGTPKAAPAAAAAGKNYRLSYDLEGRVKQANDRLNLIKIDRGEVDGVVRGQVFDLYRPKDDGTAGDLVARGVVTGVSENEAVVNLRQYKKEVWVQTGFIARRIKKTPK